MISLEHKEAMKKKSEAQTGDLQNQGYPYALPCNGSPLEGFLALKDDVVHTHSPGNILDPERSLDNKLLDSSIEFSKKPTHFGLWSPIHHPAFHKAQLCQWSGFQSPVYPSYSVENGAQYSPFNVFPQNNHPSEYQYQEFHYFVVIDFEATCDKEKIPHPQEIIEFPSVIVSSLTGQLEACFQTYVRPTCNQLLSDFCKDLTGIQQIQIFSWPRANLKVYRTFISGRREYYLVTFIPSILVSLFGGSFHFVNLIQCVVDFLPQSFIVEALGQTLVARIKYEDTMGIWNSLDHGPELNMLRLKVDRGVTLSEALLRHDKWLEKKGIKNTNFAVVTWSNWDCKVMLESECRYKKIRKPPYFNRWINLKVPFREVFGGARCNLKEAVQMAGLTWQGRPHCGLDDAKNTARLLSFLMQRGFKFSITNSMICQATDSSFTWKPSPPPHHHPSPPRYHPSPPHHNHPHGRALHSPPTFHPYCYCGVKSSKGMVRKPGPKQGSCFFGCGNWTAARGARCQYFEWASLRH